MAHWPDQHMHRAPWAKTSMAMGLWRQIWRTSSPDSSRPSTTHPMPSAAARSTPAREWTVIWVLPWRGRSGVTDRARAASPQSWTITPSTPQRLESRSMSRALSSSRSEGRVLRVR